MSVSRRAICAGSRIDAHVEVVVQRPQGRTLLQLLGDIVGMPCVHALCQFRNALEVLLVLDGFGFACRNNLIQQ
jgi:hypothetical protein